MEVLHFFCLLHLLTTAATIRILPKKKTKQKKHIKAIKYSIKPHKKKECLTRVICHGFQMYMNCSTKDVFTLYSFTLFLLNNF